MLFFNSHGFGKGSNIDKKVTPLFALKVPTPGVGTGVGFLSIAFHEQTSL